MKYFYCKSTAKLRTGLRSNGAETISQMLFPLTDSSAAQHVGVRRAAAAQ